MNTGLIYIPQYDFAVVYLAAGLVLGISLKVLF